MILILVISDKHLKNNGNSVIKTLNSQTVKKQKSSFYSGSKTERSLLLGIYIHENKYYFSCFLIHLSSLTISFFKCKQGIKNTNSIKIWWDTSAVQLIWELLCHILLVCLLSFLSRMAGTCLREIAQNLVD